MSTAATEQLHDKAGGLDARPLSEIAEILAQTQHDAARPPRHATAALCGGALAMAGTIRTGGTLHYAAAGSSGLMAAADALELGGTFSIPASQLRIHMAGGMPTGVEMPGGTEDETAELERALDGLSSNDVYIGVSASGTTPYTVAGAKLARRCGATVIGIANNPDTDLLKLADHAVLLPTPAEVVSGSTRMGAGTAQKIALNTLSTLMAIELGHVHDGMMVNLRADNIKLRARARQIVMQISDVTEDIATAAIEAAGGNVKCAILIAAGATDLADATARLETTGGKLRPALLSLNT
ncbi:N-acetylmuramic acid 6-phosphate etherase [Tritonibacter scottomollicae]|uniref:N-acetylmuramic acid 6-phosphate etherase n=1 Tax=Tritonibacter scottomollicae TaxID=483013 RepID=A0ABZ0HBR4_TRISK|nr:N-acetylmuramic acid 6-phosphate etherase [Tritonibacter scottomollicae]WOI32228.1 N-acetylmuramic acid 6-phosphate etherase [Tritonibacter scottomollicae]